jgi:NADP-dependent 3-hydroxy acid dehydrogenase YdfG
LDITQEAKMGEKRGVALVTGASSGIGRETTIKLVENGYHVIAAARRMDRLDELAGQLGNVTPKKVDLSDPDDVEQFCQEISNLPEPVSLLVNNAGYSIRGTLEDVSMEAMRRIFEVNLFSLIRVTQACLPGMRKLRKGTVVNLSTIVGKFTFPMGGAYAATKHAVEAISDALRMEVRPLGIRVITIRPGIIATEFNEVANVMSGDPMARTSPDYKPVYQAVGAGVGKMFTNLSIPGPELIANLILEAVLSDAPKTIYVAGPFSDDIFAERETLDDHAFDRYWTEKVGLTGLKV